MAATVDFASLSLQDALDLAILVEEEAQERYLEFVDQMEQHHTPGGGPLLRDHGEERAEARRGAARPAARPLRRRPGAG